MWPPRDAGWVWRYLHMFISAARPIFCRLTIEGREHMPSGGCVLASNHVMGPDFLAIAYASPRQVFFMAKQELFEVNAALTWLLTNGGAFPIRRGATDLEAVQHAMDLVRNGNVLGMFPEGTRSRDGKLQRGRSGVARIAIQTQAPVVPAVVLNAEPIFEPENYLSLKPRARITVRFGQPLPPPAEQNDSRALRAYTREVMQAIADLIPPDAPAEPDPPAPEDAWVDAPGE